MRINGGLLGFNNNATNRTAQGIWTVTEQYDNVMNNTWPSYSTGIDIEPLQKAQTRPIASYSIATQLTEPYAMQFNNDGTIMYAVGNGNRNRYVYQYRLSTPWNVSTATYNNEYYDIMTQAPNGTTVTQDPVPYGLYISNDGTQLYVFIDHYSTDNTIYQYNLSTPWNVTSASYTNLKLSIPSSTVTSSTGSMYITDNGLTLYIMDTQYKKVLQYNLSTAWNISTAVKSTKTFTPSTTVVTDSYPTGVTFNTDGTKMYIVGLGSNLYQYTLVTPWDIATAVYDNRKIFLSTLMGVAIGCRTVIFKPDGLTMYAVNIGYDTVIQYSLGTVPWQITPSSGNTATDFYSFSATDYPVDISFKDDGTVMYMLGQNTWSLYQYNLSVPWNPKSASTIIASYNVKPQESGTNSVIFKPDGTGFYVLGSIYGRIYEYQTSIPWHISNATVRAMGASITTVVPFPSAMYFRADGLMMWAAGGTSGTPQRLSIAQYNLTSPWDITTLSYSGRLFDMKVNTYDAAGNAITGLWFTSDGKRMIVAERNTGGLYQFDLTVAWDIRTSIYSGVNYYLRQLAGANVEGIYLKPDNTVLYVVNKGSSTVHTVSIAQ